MLNRLGDLPGRASDAPTLSNRMTSRMDARASVTTGSQLSSAPLSVAERQGDAGPAAEAAVRTRSVLHLEKLRRRRNVNEGGH